MEANEEDRIWDGILAVPYGDLPVHDPQVGACLGAELYLMGLHFHAMLEMLEARLTALGLPVNGLQSWPTQYEIAASLCQSGWRSCRQARPEALAALRAAGKRRRR